MTTLVLVTVCSTLSLVTLVLLFVAMFNGLSKRVEKELYFDERNALDDRILSLERSLEARINEIADVSLNAIDRLEFKKDQDYSSLKGELKNLRKTIDSRCDKLENKFLKGAQRKADSSLEEKILGY